MTGDIKFFLHVTVAHVIINAFIKIFYQRAMVPYHVLYTYVDLMTLEWNISCYIYCHLMQ